MYEEIMEIPAEHAKNVFGELDSYLKKIEKTLQVETVERDGELKITGQKTHVERAELILNQLLELSRRKNVIHEQNVNYLLSLSEPEKTEKYVEMDKSCICHTIQGKPVKPKTFGQKKYVEAIQNNKIVFGIGPAGTGKTYLAMAMAITAFQK